MAAKVFEVGNGIKITGDATITGNLAVTGTSPSSTSSVSEGKNLTLANSASNSDTNADGGGLIIKGTSDKSILWDNTNDNFTSTDHWNIASGKSFKINNVVVANSTQLGSTLRTEVLNKAESDALALAIALG